MIISDEDDTQKIKDPPAATPTLRYPERAASRPFAVLPDYETSQALAFADFNDSQVTLFKPPPRHRIFDSRFWRAATTSFVVYVLLTLVIVVPIIVHREIEKGEKYPYNSPNALIWSNKNADPNYPGNINNITSTSQTGVQPICNNWTTVEYMDGPITSFVIASTERYVSPNGSFSLTLNATCEDDLNLVQGALYTGINPNQSVQDAVISIMMQSSSPSVFDGNFVCFATANNFTNLALYVPDNLTSIDNILYNITLLFPQSTIPSQVESFETFLPMFDQYFSSFDGNVIFKRVSIGGPVSRVTVDSIQADRLLVDTSLEPVTGTFQANTSIIISTIMAPVVANISLYNDPKSLFPTALDVHTGNSNLTVNVTVLSPNKEAQQRPNFVANLRTFSGSLSTNFTHSPGSSPTTIELNVANDLGPADVVLDNLFQGAFQVSTKQGFAFVTQGNASVMDPFAPSSPRILAVDLNTTARSSGWIGWGGSSEMPWDPYQRGEVVVSSSLADVSLTFLG